MDDGTVRINELRIRVPGMSAEEGRMLGDQIMRIVTDCLPKKPGNRELAALDLKVQIRPGTSRNEMVQIVANKIRGALK
jgi:hypothetical protein